MLRLVVDPVACDAFGFCAEVAPELIHLDEWGYPVIDGEVTRATKALAGQAVSMCPRRALSLRSST